METFSRSLLGLAGRDIHCIRLPIFQDERKMDFILKCMCTYKTKESGWRPIP